MDKVKVVVPLLLIFTVIILQIIEWGTTAEVRPKVVGGEFLGEAILQKLGKFDLNQTAREADL